VISVGSCSYRVEPVGNAVFSTGWTHRQKGLDKRYSSVFPVVHTPYGFYERI
jgi:hypothetical protein